MIQIRKSDERGHFNFGWLDTYHSFSFADYHDPDHMGFRTLRVINEDRVLPQKGFDTHSHRDMEIITYVLEGALRHKDSMGTSSVIRPGEVQRMSAGSGVTHSEFNHSDKTAVHLLQIWILPNQKNLAPSYEQKTFDESEKKNKLRLVASPDGREESVMVHQNVLLYDASLDSGETAKYKPDSSGNGQWIQLIKGTLAVNGKLLKEGDGAAIEGESSLSFESVHGAEFILFDIP